MFCRILSNVSSQVECALYVRTSGDGPRLRRPFTVSNIDAFEEQPFGGLRIEANSDLMVRITAASIAASNLDVIGGYDVLLIRD